MPRISVLSPDLYFVRDDVLADLHRERDRYLYTNNVSRLEQENQKIWPKPSRSGKAGFRLEKIMASKNRERLYSRSENCNGTWLSRGFTTHEVYRQWGLEHFHQPP